MRRQNKRTPVGRTGLALARAIAVTGLTAAAFTNANAQQDLSPESLLKRIEQLQAESQLQIDALKRQVDDLKRQAQAPAVVPLLPAGVDPKKIVTAAEVPGFINVPGTEDSFKISGRLFVTANDDLTGFTNGNTAVPAPAPGNFGGSRLPVPGFSKAYAQAASVKGGFALQAWGSGIYAEIHRNTGYGPLKALVALDAVPPAQVPVNQSTSNNVMARLQRAYVSFGPWLIGQDFPNFTPSFRADTADPGPVPAIDWMLRAPQIRYTYVLNPQMQIRVAFENPDSDVSCYSGGTAGRFACGTVPTATTPATAVVTARGNNGIGFPQRPVVTLKAEYVPPGGTGLLSVHAMVHQLRVDDGAGHAAEANATAVGVAGWWNTLGNDRVYGHAFYGKGLGHFTGDWFGYSGVYDGAAKLEVPKQATVMLGYRHYWVPAVRTSLTFGAAKMGANTILPLFTDGYAREFEFVALNSNWELTGGVNLFAEYDWGRRVMQTRDSGIGRRLAGGLRFFF